MQKIGFCDKYSLTQAVLNGTKTMTRRLEKELDRLVSEYQMRYEEPIRIIEQKWDKGKNCLLLYAHTGIADTDREHVLTLNTRYKLGEVVAVAQAYMDAGIDPHYLMFATVKEKFSCVEKEIEAMFTKGWSNKLFVKPDLMPHQIQITGVRIERLQAITDDDMYKEGFTHEAVSNNWGNAAWHWEAVLVYYDRLGRTKTIQDRDPREAFAALINSPGVGRKGLWESNPWVVVYEFKLVK